jgi:hypothetical protein
MIVSARFVKCAEKQRIIIGPADGACVEAALVHNHPGGLPEHQRFEGAPLKHVNAALRAMQLPDLGLVAIADRSAPSGASK